MRVHNVVGQEGKEGLLRHPQVQQGRGVPLLPEQGQRPKKVQTQSPLIHSLKTKFFHAVTFARSPFRILFVEYARHLAKFVKLSVPRVCTVGSGVLIRSCP